MSDFEIFKSFLDAPRDSNLFPRFYDRAVKTNEINPKTQLPVFKDVCFVEIRMKDNNTDVFDQPAKEEHKKRFPEAYKLYEYAKKQVAEGTPIEQFAFLTGAQVETLKMHGVFTVEALVKLTVKDAASIDVAKEREAAVKFLKMAEHNFDVDAFVKEKEAYEAEISKLKEEIETLKQK